jgi:1,4-dihydroxy-2-naphthoyl-CoA hydrolase
MKNSIWQTRFSLQKLNEMSENTLQQHLGIEFVEVGDDYLKARMPVDWRVRQPYGILHGGASVVLAETTGSMAAHMCVDPDKTCIGLDINANHILMVKSGMIYCVARPAHLGRNTHVWQITISNENEQTVCESRLTMLVLAPGS